ncbi:MAG TPA: SDR family oxidoreductase [Acidimicrobiia bacterium]|nr:SDR family oxidoreductase [Acidimicrobiia bacterium]
MAPDRLTVLVTGSNSGIGLATVLEAARGGLRAVGTVRSEAKAEVVQAAAREAGVEVETALVDVTDADACVEVVDRYRPDALVNNAGFSVTGAVEDVSDDEARRALETMVLAPARLARLAIPHMRERGRGRVVNVSSIFGRATAPLNGWYQASKHALEALSDALRAEVARDGIAVVLVEPGGFRTGIWDEVEGDVEELAGSRYEAAYRRTLGLSRLSEPVMGDPSRVAKVIMRAVTARRPRARYLVGVDARAFALAEGLTPTAVTDRVKRFTLGL